MSRYKDERLVNKVDELAASLHATSEVLTTADHMLEQYRDMNKEQDAEIARVFFYIVIFNVPSHVTYFSLQLLNYYTTL